MANVKDLKKRIKSTKSTHKITSAMKLVSAAKLSKAQSAITGARPYAGELEDTIKTVSALIKDYTHEFLKQTDNNKMILLVLSSDKGLCGGYNSGLAKAVKNYVAKNSDKDIKVYFIGKKVKELITKSVNSGKTFTFNRTEPSYDEVRKVCEELAHHFTTGEVGSINVAYNQFQSAISVIPTISQVLPLSFSSEEQEKLQSEFPFDFKYEPTPKEILDALIPQVYVTSVYTKVLDSIASEHGSRMSAMENASKNCKEMIKKLTIKMNKMRQAAITTQLIEVVSGAESLNG
ncbi:MAG: ATP synthase F1 subunit gamma [Bacteriovoracaceae bacterium]